MKSNHIFLILFNILVNRNLIVLRLWEIKDLDSLYKWPSCCLFFFIDNHYSSYHLIRILSKFFLGSHLFFVLFQLLIIILGNNSITRYQHDIKSINPFPASLYCKVVELYTTVKWKIMDLEYFWFWHDCLSNLEFTLGEFVECIALE